MLQHIIDVHLHGVPDQVLKDFVYHPLEGCPCVLNFEGRHLIAVDSLTIDEGSFVFIWWVHLDLIVAEIGIYEVKKLVSCCGFHQLVDPRERVTILWKGFIEIYKVNADSALPFFFLHECGIGESVGVKCLSDEAW